MIKSFPFRIDYKLKRKLDLLYATLEKKDVWILVDGDEGSGKTNAAAYLLYYFHCMSGRDFSLDRFYFDTDAMFDWVKDNKEGLVNWDEAALGGLSTEWWSHSQTNLIKFALVGRIKHHIFVMCIPRFNKLREDLRLDRIHAMIHMDLGKKGNKYGHYCYLTKRGIRELNRLWRVKKIRAYNKCSRKYGGFYGDIPFVFEKLVDNTAYEKKKNDAISNIGVKKVTKDKEDIKDLRYRVGKLKCPIKTREELAEKLGISYETVRKWLNSPPTKDNLLLTNGVVGKDDDVVGNEVIEEKEDDE
jgi:hypothetical protein